MRLKKCRKCEKNLPLDSFTSTMAKYCEKCKYIVAIEKKHERTLRQLERSKTKKQKRKTIISLADDKKRTQIAFNKWIRRRDEDEPCISCDTHTSNIWDAGHFWAMGSKSALRYHPDNCHKQCRSCNRFKRGNLLEYRIRLKKKIGKKRMQYLEDHRNDTKRWTREELKEIREKCK